MRRRRARASRTADRARRLGGHATRPRWAGLRRSPRQDRDLPDRRQSGAGSGCHGSSPRDPKRVRVARRGRGRPARARGGEPEPSNGRGRGPGGSARDPLPLSASSVSARRGGCRRDAPPALSLARPAAAAAAAEHRAALEDGLDDPAGNGRRRLPRDRDADSRQADAGRGPGLPRPEPAAPGALLRAAAVAADLQAAPRHLGIRPLLPDRAVLPGRGPSRRPCTGDHSARRRDGVSRTRR